MKICVLRVIGFALRLSVAALERGSKQPDGGLPQMAKQLREEKTLAGARPTGHSGNYIKTELDNPIYAAG